MPKIICFCGNVIEDISIPNPHGFLLVSEKSLDELETMAIADKWDCATLLDRMTTASKQVYRCEKCGNLIVFDQGKTKFPSVYNLKGSQ